MSDWWSRKLSPDSGKAGLRVPYEYPQPQQPQPVQHQPQQQVQHQPQPQPQQPAADPQQEITMGEAIRTWSGGEAHRKEGHLACPACGSATGYTEYSAAGHAGSMINGQRPRGHCFECGYNGHFTQGLESSWA
jgi:hypothetical protein